MRLRFREWKLLESRIKGNQELAKFHDQTKFRLEKANYGLTKILKRMSFDTRWSFYLDGFLIQGKAALDSFCHEINLKYNIHVRSNWSFSVEELLMGRKGNNLALLSQTNPSLGSLVQKELNKAWYSKLKDLRDVEGVHGSRISRQISIVLVEPGGEKERGASLRGADVRTFSSWLRNISNLTEDGYQLIS